MRLGADALQRLAQFVEQPRVVDGDHCLIGKAFHQVEFVRLERPHLASSDDHHTDRLSLPRERRDYLRPYRHLVQGAGDLSDCTRKADMTILDNNLATVQVTAHRQIRRLVEWLIRQSVPHPSSEGTCRPDHAKNIALDAPEVDTGGVEHSHSCLGDRIERALTVLWCAGDDTENVSRRGLPFERLPQFAQQPRILDGDDGLGGEVLDQLDLFVGEWPHLGAVDENRADEIIVLEHGDAEDGSPAENVDEFLKWLYALEIRQIFCRVCDMNKLLCLSKASQRCLRVKMEDLLGLSHLGKVRRHAVQRDSAEAVAFGAPQEAQLRLADARRIGEHCLKHRRQLPRRTTDDSQYFRCRGLLLQRLTQFVEQPRVLDGDDGLGGEVLHQRDLLLRKWPNLLT